AEYVFARPGAIGLLSTENPEAHIEASAHDRLKQAVRPHMHEMMSGLAKIVKQGIEAGEFRDVDPVMAALMFGLAFRSSVTATRHELGVREPRAAAFDILLYGLLRPDSGKTAQESK
ncbi:MAG: hypothetical protein JSU73_05630, partial [candidate division WOR-3 bacterium]